MGVNTDQVFLVPGQKKVADSGKIVLSPKVEHWVVVAPDQVEALRLLDVTEPAFKPLGTTTLKEFEDAVLRIRATLEGKTEGYPMLVHPQFG